MASRDLYDILSISRTASADEIRRAHRKLALQFHPDRNKAKDAPAKFAEIQEAYEVLSDAEKRRQYDDFIRLGGSPGAFGANGPTGGSGGGSGGGHGQHPGGASGGGWSNGGGGEPWTATDSETFESIFGDMFGGRGGPRGRPPLQLHLLPHPRRAKRVWAGRGALPRAVAGDLARGAAVGGDQGLAAWRAEAKGSGRQPAVGA